MAEPWASVLETHTAALFFAGNRVYKVKKPVRLDFLDLSCRDARIRACQQEVALNRRLAPDVYLGVASIGLEAEPAEPAVVMRRLPQTTSLASRLLADDETLAQHVVEIADVIARFHQGCRVVGRDLPDDLWSSPADLWRTEVHRLQALHVPGICDETLQQALQLAVTYAGGRSRLFARRLAEGLVRDGHGDLLASDIYLLTDGVRVLDCLEFDDRLRVCDVLHDVAFLAMDLEHLGRPDLADVLLDRYSATSGERHPQTLAHFFVAHRALIRAKVHAVRAQQREDMTDRTAETLIDLCLTHLGRAQVRLVLVGGLPGSGKSTLAAALAAELPAHLLSSDQIRQELTAGLATGSEFETGRYTPAISKRVYQEVLRRAREALDRGEHVVADASWRSALDRRLARELAADAGAVAVEILLDVDDRTANERLARRVSGASGASEATAAIRQRMRTCFDAWPDATVVAAEASIDDCVDAALGIIHTFRKEQRR